MTVYEVVIAEETFKEIGYDPTEISLSKARKDSRGYNIVPYKFNKQIDGYRITDYNQPEIYKAGFKYRYELVRGLIGRNHIRVQTNTDYEFKIINERNSKPTKIVPFTSSKVYVHIEDYVFLVSILDFPKWCKGAYTSKEDLKFRFFRRFNYTVISEGIGYKTDEWDRVISIYEKTGLKRAAKWIDPDKKFLRSWTYYHFPSEEKEIGVCYRTPNNWVIFFYDKSVEVFDSEEDAIAYLDILRV